MDEQRKLDFIAEELLSQLERKENQLLEWGFIGGTVDAEAEIREILTSPPTPVLESVLKDIVLDEAFVAMMVKNLKERRLLFPIGGRYRSRYAETIRLLILLKQRFKFTDWQSGRNLISNVKPLLAYRKYPYRNIPLSQVEEIIQEVWNDPLVLECVRGMLRDGAFELAQFQVDALRHLFETRARTDSDRGTVIGAGTGSGKTKAFYIPAFAHLAYEVRKNPEPWTKVVGIYPRVELLKDQFREAIREIGMINARLADKGVRPVTIGGYYGDTPRIAEDVIQHENRKWKRSDRGYICPFFTCPECGGDMLWSERELHLEINGKTGEHERLNCVSCHFVAGPETVMLTRRRMMESPPDVLFTSTEMLNLKLTNRNERHLFGVMSVRPPLYVLLDEVHIYEGVNGAHVAYLLRRWRNQMRWSGAETVHYVGLSATLSNAESFFAQLIGLSRDKIMYVMPREADMAVEGVEYNLIVRGDPFSGATLLSASVQTAMLLGRMLDPLNADVSRGAFGKKLFGFTDKLDVINRWYHIQSDAEHNQVLSKFRDPELFDEEMLDRFDEQNILGQVWLAAKEIDPDSLRRPMVLDITSSQNKGVKEDAKFVVATSTLEVGYNDPRVGAVIQHKAPRNLASFLQRKGRAGRVRGMRPWTVVVTSAYGRDRFAYDYPELLFQPVLSDLSLPLRNQFVQRIQTAFAFMDYLSYKISSTASDIRNLLTYEGSAKNKRSVNEIIHIIYKLLEGQDGEWRQFLANALQLSESEIDRVLWTPPRSFYFQLLPTLLNQLETGFSGVSEEERNTPLAGYIPRTLFAALEVEDLLFQLPSGKTEPMALVQGIIEFAPGNVSKRFVRADRIHEAHWVLAEGDHLDLNGANVKSIAIETVDDQGGPIVVCEPYAIKLDQIPKDVSDRSTAFHQWRVCMEPYEPNDADRTHIELVGNVNGLFRDVKLYSCEQNSYVKITRYSPRVKAEIKHKDGNTSSRSIDFRLGTQRAAMGFQRMSDALRFEVEQPDIDFLFGKPNWGEIASESKPDFYLYLLHKDEELTSRLNVFEISWLAQITVSSIVAIAVRRRCSMKEAVSEFADKREAIAKRTLQLIYQSTVTQMSADEDEGKVYRRLLAYIADPSVMRRFIEIARIFYEDIRQHPDIREWLIHTTVATYAAAIQQAVGEMLPDVNTEDLILDIRDGSIWLSEPESGGLGVISKIASVLKMKPALFAEWFTRKIHYCHRDHMAAVLKYTLPLLVQPDFAGLAAKIREEKRIERQKELLAEFQRELDAQGISPQRDTVAMISNKLLKVNASHNSDRLMRQLHEKWKEEERRIECKIELNVYAVACTGWEEIGQQLDQMIGRFVADQALRESQRYQIVESLLFSGCKSSCPECLNLYSPFQSFLKPSRIIAAHMLEPTHQVVRVHDPNWQDKVQSHLSQGKRVRIVVIVEEQKTFQRELLRLLHEAIELSYEVFYPFVESVHNHGQEWHYDLCIREVSHV